MQLDFTVDVRGNRSDVALIAPDSATVGEIAPALRAVLDADAAADAHVWHADRPLKADVALADAGLRVGAVVGLGRPAGSRSRPPVLALQVIGGADAGRVVGLERGRLHIGRDPACELQLADADVSRCHAMVEVGSHVITLRDLGSTNGTSVDGQPVGSDGCALRPGCLIGIGDSLLTVAGPLDAPATVQAGPDGTVAVLRPPRRRLAVVEAEVGLPASPAGSRPRGVQWVTALLPAAAGGAIAWFAHSPQFLLFALLSPVMMLSTALGDRLHWRRSRRRDAATFNQRRADAARCIDEALAAEVAARRASAPDAATIAGMVSLPTCRLWERRPTDDDFLQVRLGTAVLPSTLRVRDGSTVAPAASIPSVPLTVDLRRGPVGMAGPPQVVGASARWLVGQLAALHSPADVEFALLLDADREADWTWARWLPHVRGRVASTQQTWGDLVADLTAALDRRRGPSRLDRGSWVGPWLVLVVDRMSRLGEVPGLPDLLARGAGCGITAICVGNEPTALPTSCAAVARVSGDTGSRFRLHETGDTDATVGVLDGVSASWADDVARGLAPLTDAGVSGTAALPDTCRLLEVLGLDELDGAVIEQRWALSDGGASTVIGRSPDGELRLDLVGDGPHALIAGTTGAGKSELLQALVVGLAANHPPDDINFLLIDYKGGAAFGECARLPHTAGLVTDLDRYLTERALRSLTSELRRRERLFAEVGAADLAAYRRAAPADPIGRLVIVVDEFASLADELPDFVRGLVGVAQRGRSLGVHLVLATQRPGRALSPEIRANTSLRIALRVTDPGESTDIIDAADAAAIDRAFPGRAYLRTGSSLSCFQAAHAGGPPRPHRTAVRVELLRTWRRADRHPAAAAGPTEIAQLVDAVCAAAARTGRLRARSPWLPPLPDALPRATLERAAEATTVALGRVDLPDEQRCTTLTVDLAAGSSFLAAGAARSGRTALLGSLAVGAAEQLGPAELNVHLIDATGGLASALRPLPHTGTVLGPDDASLAPRLLQRLERECARRLSERTSGVRAGDRPTRLLLLVDGWESLSAALGDVDAAGCADTLAALLRVGPAVGLSIAVTGDRSTLAPRFSGTFAQRILLRLPDRSDYALAGAVLRDVPAVLPPGRGLRAGDGAVVQVAHAGNAPGPAGLREAVIAATARWPAAKGCAPGAERILVRPLPTRVTLRELAPMSGIILGLGGDEARPLVFDPFAGAARLLVAGPPRSGRTTLLRSIAVQAAGAGVATVVAAPPRSALADAARALALRVLSPTDDDVGPVPVRRTLLLVDDCEAFVDSPAGDRLAAWARSPDAAVAVVAAGRADDLATTYRGVAAEVRRSHCGILLRPGPVDGELLGARLPRRPSTGPPGRGVAIGDASWAVFDDGNPVPIQVAEP